VTPGWNGRWPTCRQLDKHGKYRLVKALPQYEPTFPLATCEIPLVSRTTRVLGSQISPWVLLDARTKTNDLWTLPSLRTKLRDMTYAAPIFIDFVLLLVHVLISRRLRSPR
jgi:hypothetical protein